MCGASLRADEAAGEVRREVTIVTSDLKGSTALGEQLDPEALREVLNRYFAVMRAVFESHGGTIEKIIGDAIVAVFGLPFRHDDDPLRGLEAAAESQRATATLNDELEQGWGVRLTVRTGVATGEVTFGKAEGGQHVLLGGPVEVGTTMEQNAPSHEVLVHESTVGLVEGQVELEDFGLVSPKGSDETFHAYRLVAVRERATADEAVVPEALPGMRICPGCGEQNPERMRFCTICGASLTESIVRESRRTVTIVFAMPKVHSLSGETVGPEALRDVMSRYFDGMRNALERHGGTVEKFIGDAVMAVFGGVLALPNPCESAFAAATEMRRALSALNEKWRREGKPELQNGIGLHFGDVLQGTIGSADRKEFTVIGDAVNIAARLESISKDVGQNVVLSGAVADMLTESSRARLQPLGPMKLKGKDQAVETFGIA
jgi:class 3 adenylate cyclase